MIINYIFMLFQVCAWCIFSLWIEYSKYIYLFLEKHVIYNLDNINLYTPINFLLVSITYLFVSLFWYNYLTILFTTWEMLAEDLNSDIILHDLLTICYLFQLQILNQARGRLIVQFCLNLTLYFLPLSPNGCYDIIASCILMWHCVNIIDLQCVDMYITDISFCSIVKDSSNKIHLSKCS